jgi:hypothetical protein
MRVFTPFFFCDALEWYLLSHIDTYLFYKGDFWWSQTCLASAYATH